MTPTPPPLSSRRSCLKFPSTPGTPNSAGSCSPGFGYTGASTPRSARKSVAFCAACDGLEEVHVADDWDRTPTEPARTPLSYQDILELKAIQRTLPRAQQLPDLYTGKPASQYLSAVPIGLLPLLPGDQPGTPHPTPVSTPGSTPAGSTNNSTSPSREASARNSPSHSTNASRDPSPKGTPNGSTLHSPLSSPVLPRPSSPPTPFSSSSTPSNLTSPLSSTSTPHYWRSNSPYEEHNPLQLYPNPPHSPPTPRSPEAEKMGLTQHFPYSHTYSNSYSTSPGHQPGRLKPIPIIPLGEGSPSPTVSNAPTPTQTTGAVNASDTSSWRSYTPPAPSAPGAKIPAGMAHLAHLMPMKPKELPKRKPNIAFLPLLESPPVVSPTSPDAQGGNANMTPTPESIAQRLENLGGNTTPRSVVNSGHSTPSTSTPSGSTSESGSISPPSTSETSPNSDVSADSTPKTIVDGVPNPQLILDCSSASVSTSDESSEVDTGSTSAPPTPALTTTSLTTDESELETDSEEMVRVNRVRLGGLKPLTRINSNSKPNGEDPQPGGNYLGLTNTERQSDAPKTRKVLKKVRVKKEKPKEVMFINGMEVEIDDDGPDEFEEVEVEVEEPIVEVQAPRKEKKEKRRRKKKEVMFINGMEMEISGSESESDDSGREDCECSTTTTTEGEGDRSGFGKFGESGIDLQSKSKPSLVHTRDSNLSSTSTPLGLASAQVEAHSSSAFRKSFKSKPSLYSNSDPSSTSTSTSESESSCSSLKCRRPTRPPPLENYPGERIVSLPEVPTRRRGSPTSTSSTATTAVVVEETVMVPVAVSVPVTVPVAVSVPMSVDSPTLTPVATPRPSSPVSAPPPSYEASTSTPIPIPSKSSSSRPTPTSSPILLSSFPYGSPKSPILSSSPRSPVLRPMSPSSPSCSPILRPSSPSRLRTTSPKRKITLGIVGLA